MRKLTPAYIVTSVAIALASTAALAPRTDRDLTHQMPDDPIIRY